MVRVMKSRKTLETLGKGIWAIDLRCILGSLVMVDVHLLVGKSLEPDSTVLAN